MKDEKGHLPDQRRECIWFTDGSKTNKVTEAGVYCYGTRQRLGFSLGKYTAIFQAEVYVIKACAVENIKRDYRERTFIFSVTPRS
jgi:hypothetical protein